jgi:predicted transcriptional regulator
VSGRIGTRRNAIVLSKESILKALEGELSEDADLNDAIDYLLYLAGIEEGLADVEAGRVISHEEMLNRVDQWSK